MVTVSSIPQQIYTALASWWPFLPSNVIPKIDPFELIELDERALKNIQAALSCLSSHPDEQLKRRLGADLKPEKLPLVVSHLLLSAPIFLTHCQM